MERERLVHLQKYELFSAAAAAFAVAPTTTEPLTTAGAATATTTEPLTTAGLRQHHLPKAGRGHALLDV